MGEFELINRFFKQKTGFWLAQSAQSATQSIVFGIGDDCALLQPAPGMQLAVSTDMLVEGRHFLPDVDPAALGHKALAVNLSDLAAMGAEPLAFTLALALPPARAADTTWLDALGDGLLGLARTHDCPLVGGDTTAGPLNLCITVFGQVPAGLALRRDGARAGDDLWVSGTPGDARLALGALRGEWTLAPPVLERLRTRLERPTPRLALGRRLRSMATSCIDVSDGLLGDLGHILDASDVGATVDAAKASEPMTANLDPSGAAAGPGIEIARGAALAGGDDYELVFTAPPAARAGVLEAGVQAATRVTRIGRIEAAPGLRVTDGRGGSLDAGAWRSFDHFA